jgi:hypothetical protein
LHINSYSGWIASASASIYTCGHDGTQYLNEELERCSRHYSGAVYVRVRPKGRIICVWRLSGWNQWVRLLALSEIKVDDFNVRKWYPNPGFARLPHSLFWALTETCDIVIILLHCISMGLWEDSFKYLHMCSNLHILLYYILYEI